MNEQSRLGWGILGAGRIARQFAAGLRECETGVLQAVGSRSIEKAQAWASEFGDPTAYGSYEALLSDADVDAVYVATPHPWHCEWAVKAAEAGKHVLCEKPLGMNHPEAMLSVETAERNGVFLMEAFMYRCYPQTKKIVELVRDGTLGEIQLIEAQFAFRGGNDPASRLMDPALGGGGILDVGCYPVSMARLVAGAAIGLDVCEPRSLSATAYKGETGVDEYATAVLAFPGNILAQLATGIRLRGRNEVVITGTEARLTIPEPWFGGRDLLLERASGEPELISVPFERQRYAYEADTFAARLAGEDLYPAMTAADSLGNMHVLDQWRSAIDLTYPCETAQSVTFPMRREQVTAASPNSMRYGRLPGLDKDISLLIMGVDNQDTLAHCAVTFDDFIERGGNCFDTAEIYAKGMRERLLGEYLEMRGLRDDVVILNKDAHSPDCFPHVILERIDQRLANLRTDTIDLYLMHRDNPDVPAGEFVDVLNQLKDEGKIKVFGGSNWSNERFEAANAYAAENGKTGFACISNNFSLAQMIRPVWAGCIASSTPEMLQWHTETQTPLLGWSSQARGFFTDRSGPDKLDDESLATCWYSDENFERKRRAEQLAADLGVLPINIALAYVLCQPFPTWALIGPRTLEETRTSWPGLDIELTPEQLAWLNLEKD